MAKQKYLLPILALFVANILWGTNAVFIKMGVESIPVPIFMSIRFLTASLILLPIVVHTWKPLKRRDFWLFILSSVFAISLSALALNIGLSKTTASNAAVISLMSPVVIFVLSAQFLKERMQLKTFLGILIALVGAVVIIGRPEGSGTDGLTGNLFVVISIFCSAINVIICKPLMKKASDSQVTFMSLFPGIIPIAIYAITQLHTWDIPATTSKSIQGLVYSTVAIVIANFLFYYGLRHKRAQQVGVYHYLQPVVTIATAWFLLAERPTFGLALGASLVFAGVYLTEIRRSKHHPIHHHKGLG